jgi:DNA-binding ferritin-like protein
MKKQKHSCGKTKQHIVDAFMEFLNELKVYHWNAKAYSAHKASDELYGQLNDHIDKFVEVLLGKKEEKLTKINRHIPLRITYSKMAIKDITYEFREYLIRMNACLDKERDSDLLNIRDEILADINQFLYLLKLK